MILALISPYYSSQVKTEGTNIHPQLVKINGEYLIERIIRIAVQNGVKNVSCIINENEPELEHYLQTTNLGVHLDLIVKNTLNSMHSLSCLATFLKSEAFCLTTTNSVFDENEFSEFINYSSLQRKADGALAVTQSADKEKPFCVAMDEEDTIKKFSDSKDGYNWATGGIYYFSPKVFDEIMLVLGTGVLRFKNVLRLLVSQGYILKGFSFSKIINVALESDIKRAEFFVKEKIAS